MKTPEKIPDALVDALDANIDVLEGTGRCCDCGQHLKDERSQCEKCRRWIGEACCGAAQCDICDRTLCAACLDDHACEWTCALCGIAHYPRRDYGMTWSEEYWVCPICVEARTKHLGALRTLDGGAVSPPESWVDLKAADMRHRR
jgi:hypothetical protein